jgi:hypothetical protein
MACEEKADKFQGQIYRNEAERFSASLGYRQKLTERSRALGAARDTAAHRGATGNRIAHLWVEGLAMDAIVIVGAVVGSFAGAFVLQKAALEGLFRMMNADRRTRH